MRSPDDTTEITRTENLFVYHIFGAPREMGKWKGDPASYSLRIGGLAESPKSLSLEQIRIRFHPVEADVILQCMTNVHWGRVRVRGARLLDILDDVRIKAGAKKLGFRGAEGYTTDLFIDEIREDPQRFILAYEMNGEPLTADHGFPLRVVAEGKYAYKWCKWLTMIDVVDHDFKGHYEGTRGWSDAATRGRPVC